MKQSGYTLTEMLIVIAIIGLIAAVVTPALTGQLGRARVKAAQMQLHTTWSAVQAFNEDVGRAPTTTEGLAALIRDPGVEGWTGPYLRDETALKDPWGTPLSYALDSSGRPVVSSLGADARVGGAGQDRDLRAPSVR